MILSRHATKRMQQRGYREEEMALIEEVASEAPDGLFLQNKDIKHEIARLNQEQRSIQRQIERLRRLKGTFVAISGATAMTVYRPKGRKARHILHGKRDKGIK